MAPAARVRKDLLLRHKPRRLLGPIAALAVAALVVAGDSGEVRAQQTGPSGDTAPRQLGVVGVQARIGRDDVRSSGIVIDAERGLVVTNAHSLWGAKSLRVATDLGVLYGRVVARDACDDLAVLELQPRIPGLSALLTRTSGAGDGWVETLGRRFATPVRGQDTLIRVPTELRRRSTRRPRVLPTAREVVALDSALVPEATGAALLDREGGLWGMAQVVARPRRATSAFGIPADLIRLRLDELEPGPRTVFVGWRERYRCAPRLHAFNRETHPGFRPSDARLNAPVPATRVPGTEELDSP